MRKTIYSKYDKGAINALPVEVFGGRIEVVLSAERCRPAVDFLLSADILGLDTETRPSFRRGTRYEVSLLQVSTREVCFLFRLNHTGLNADLVRLLEDTAVPKIGLSLHDDISALHRVAPFTPGYFIDLQKHVSEVGVEDLSLQKLYANFFSKKISKAQRLTNWEADILSDKQKVYAATDAWACIMLYDELMRLEATGDFCLVKEEVVNDGE